MLKIQSVSETTLQKLVLFIVLLSAFTTPLMLSAVNVALPLIGDDLKLTAVMLSWVPMAYLMASAIWVLIFGQFADIYGRKRLFLVGVISVICSSFLAAFASNGIWLIGARVLQGTSAAMLYATQIALVSSVFPKSKRGTVIGLTISMVYLGLTCGPFIGGYLVNVFGWRVSFIFHIPLALVVFFIGCFKVKGEWRAKERKKLDMPGAFFYGFTIIFLCLSFSNLPLYISIACFLASGLSSFLFLRAVRYSQNPIFDINLLLENRVLTFSCLAAFIIYTGIFANVVLISLFLQYLKGYTPSQAGIIMMIQPLVMTLCSPYMGRLSDYKEPQLLTSLGMATTAVGLFLLVMLSVTSSISYLVCALFITGLGVSLFSSPNANIIMSSVSSESYGRATGLLATMRITGQMASMVLVSFVFSLLLDQQVIAPSNYAILERAIQLCFMIAFGLCLLGIYLSVVRRNRPIYNSSFSNKDKKSS